MKLKFWGVRGSTPVAERDKMEYGGNTTCIEVESSKGDHYVVDAGSGIRALGYDLIRRHQGKPFDTKLFMTHVHWDHIQGFPFFTPAYVPGMNLTVYSGKKKSKFDSALKGNNTFEKLARAAERKGELTKHMLELQQSKYVFPIEIGDMMSKKNFVDLQDGEMVQNGMAAHFKRFEFAHPDGITSYKFVDGGKTFVVQADFEHGAILPKELRGAKIAENEETAKQLEHAVNWWKGADAVYFDAQYFPEEYDPQSFGKPGMSKKLWGHSTYEKGIDLALQAGVKHLFLGHHEPTHSDIVLDDLAARAQNYLAQKAVGKKLQVTLVKEGLEHML